MRRVMGVGLVLLGGCPEEFVPSIYDDAQLPAATVRLTDDEGSVAGQIRRDWAGTLGVTGDGDNFELQVSGSGFVELAVYTPSGTDLGLFSGLDVLLSVSPEQVTDDLSLAIADSTTDELLYLLEPVRPALLTEERFGPNMLAIADDLGSVQESGWNVALSSYYMRTDAGDVNLYPGAPQEVMLSGSHYRAVLLAGFDAERVAQVQTPDCLGAEDRTALELTKVDEGTADLTPIVRDETLPLPLAVCANTPTSR